ncbi:MAG: MBL fold metallo-hydrolase [Kangiellaceae bacterium]|nr:MBL fold metallo-hydrolase [Kangiellaceae bacterium]MCW9017234.1 MBL fold metallo-hydrolase [Kangiellaceae bacterium]
MKKLIKLTLIGSALMASSIGFAQDGASPDFATTEVSKGLYMLSGVGGFTGGNIGLSVGEDGVVMIDDSMPPLLDKMKKAIASVTPNKVDFLINTHVHGDHTGNNEAMGKDGTHIVAHDNLRRHLIKKGVRTQDGMKPAPKHALPVITFSKSMSFHLNGEEANIFHVAHAHTDGDAIIHFKDANVIHTGDTFFNGMFPYIDLASGGSVKGYIKAQQRVIKLSNDKTKIIPGHGPLATKKDLQAAVDMLIDSKKLIKALVKAGKSEDEVVKANPLKKYHDKWNWQFITTERMTRQIYKGISQSKKHKKVSKAEHGHSH